MPPPSASSAPDAALIARFRGDLDRLAARGALAANARLGLAVSGGPDSMALLVLAHAAFPGRIAAATFDHRLRPGSEQDAVLVAERCRVLGVPHATLTPAAPIAGASLQRAAREARYGALTGWAKREGLVALVTAHHADDQAETLLMRLNRASGLAGLSSIRPVRSEDGVLLLRPLLGWRRAELRAIVAEAGVPFVDDPANTDPRHDRTRIRAALAATPALDPAALAASAGYLAEAEEVIADAADRLWAQRWSGGDSGFDLADVPRELRRRLVRRAILVTRDRHALTAPVFDSGTNVEPLLDALEAERSAVQGGVKVTPGPGGWRFVPAPPRRG